MRKRDDEPQLPPSQDTKLERYSHDAWIIWCKRSLCVNMPLNNMAYFVNISKTAVNLLFKNKISTTTSCTTEHKRNICGVLLHQHIREKFWLSVEISIHVALIFCLGLSRLIIFQSCHTNGIEIKNHSWSWTGSELLLPTPHQGKYTPLRNGQVWIRSARWA